MAKKHLDIFGDGYGKWDFKHLSCWLLFSWTDIITQWDSKLVAVGQLRPEIPGAWMNSYGHKSFINHSATYRLLTIQNQSTSEILFVFNNREIQIPKKGAMLPLTCWFACNLVVCWRSLIWFGHSCNLNSIYAKHRLWIGKQSYKQELFPATHRYCHTDSFCSFFESKSKPGCEANHTPCIGSV